MATREQIGGTREDERRPAATTQPASRASRRALGPEAATDGVFPPGWWRGLFSRPKKPLPGGEIIYRGFAPGWWRGLFSRPKRPVPGGEIVYRGFAPGWWRFLFRRTTPRSPR